MYAIADRCRGVLVRAAGVLSLVFAATAGAQQVDYCNLQFPTAFSAASGASSPLIYGRIFEDDNGVLTSNPGAHPSIVAQLGHGPLGSDPRGDNPAWQWSPASYNVQVGNDDEYRATVTAPFAPAGTQRSYTYRFSVDAGAEFTYCDTDGNGSNGGLGFSLASLGTMTITGGGLPAISIDDVSGDEGDSGATAFTFTISLSGPSVGPVSFDIATADGSATVADGDYLAASATAVTIAAGQTSTSFVVTVNGDTVQEPDQTFFVNLANVTGAVVADAQGTGTLVNDDDPCAAIVFPYTLAGNTQAELVQAIQCAHANGPGSDTIDLGGQTVTLTARHAIELGSGVGLPQITTAVVIRNGTLARSSSDLFRHFLVLDGNLRLEDMTLSNGDSQSDGGSVMLFGAASLTLERCRLIGNFGNFGGALFVASTADATINNSLIAGNRASAPGGGIRNRGLLVLNNSTVAANFTTAGSEGGGGIANNGGSVTLNNSIVFGNESSSFPTTHEIRGTFASSNSLVGVDPSFVQRLDAGDTAPTTGGNYRLRHFSVAIDAGNNALVPPGTSVDLDGNGRFFDDMNVADTGAGPAPIVDIGAYEKRTDSQPPQADLSISKTDGRTSVLAGSATTYTLVVTNAGPDDAPATVIDSFPPTLTGVTWACIPSAGASCAPTGSGTLVDSVMLPAGSSVTYSVDATVDPAASGILANIATVAIGGGVTDPQESNNAATDTTSVIALPLISVEDASEAEGDGGSRALGVTVRLSGPAPAGGVTFDIATADATASAGSDYTARALTSQVIPAGSTTYLFEVMVDGDARVEPDEVFLIEVDAVSGAQIADAQGQVTLVNDDVAAVTVAPMTVNVAEGGASGSYDLVLTSEPDATVTVTVSGDAQVSATPPTLQFTAANWNLAQTVTVAAIDDAVAEGMHAGSVSHFAAGGEYAAVAIASVTVSIADDDSAGVSVVESGGATAVTEGGADDVFSVVLNAQPAADVAITLQPDAQVEADPATLLFTPVNWNIAQSATVRAVDDAVAEGSHAGSVGFVTDSADAGFDGLALAPVLVAIGDNDTMAVILVESAGSTAVREAGAGDSYSLVLGSEPVADVTLHVSGDAQVQASPPTLVFTPANWNLAQNVTVTAIDDALVEGAHAGSITHAASGGGYDAVAIPAVTVAITDNDFIVGGSVSGLTGAGLVLQNNGGDDLAIASDGTFAFAQALADGSAYAVTILSQPATQTCVASNATGAIAGADVTQVGIHCGDRVLELSTTQLSFGSLTGGSGSASFTLRNVGAGDLVLDAITAPAAPFALDGGSCLALPLTLAPGAACEVRVRFTPTALGNHTGSITISSNAAASPHQVAVSGTLLAVAAPVLVPATAPFGLMLLALGLAALGLAQARAGRRQRG